MVLYTQSNPSHTCMKNKKVLIPAMTFTATAAAALYCGLEPVFVDINEEIEMNKIYLLNFF